MLIKEVLLKEVSVASLVIPVHIQSKNVSAVVDTAEQVSVLNLSLARELGLTVDNTHFIYLQKIRGGGGLYTMKGYLGTR